MQIQEFKAKVVNILEEAPEVKTFQIECPIQFAFKPGQFVMLALPDNPKLAKAYSIASSPSKQGMIDLTIRIESYPDEELHKHLTPKLGKISKGQEVIVKGPYGHFVLDEEKEDYIFLTAGTGLAPMMSMIRYCLDNNLNKKIILINSARTPRHILYKKELESIKDKITWIQTITRPEEMEHGEIWDGKKGRIDRLLLEESINKKESLFYICGPNEMVKAIRQHLFDLGIEKENIKVELWG